MYEYTGIKITLKMFLNLEKSCFSLGGRGAGVGWGGGGGGGRVCL